MGTLGRERAERTPAACPIRERQQHPGMQEHHNQQMEGHTWDLGEGQVTELGQRRPKLSAAWEMGSSDPNGCDPEQSRPT